MTPYDLYIAKMAMTPVAALPGVGRVLQAGSKLPHGLSYMGSPISGNTNFLVRGMRQRNYSTTFSKGINDAWGQRAYGMKLIPQNRQTDQLYHINQMGTLRAQVGSDAVNVAKDQARRSAYPISGRAY